MKVINIARRNILSETLAALLILLFVYVALSKITKFTSFAISLTQSPLIENKAMFFAYAIPAIELLVSVLLFFPRTRLWGFYSSSVLMILFTGYVTYLVVYVPHVPCSCGGVLKSMTWMQHLYFNIIYTLIALTGVLIERNRLKSKTVEATYQHA